MTLAQKWWEDARQEGYWDGYREGKLEGKLEWEREGTLELVRKLLKSGVAVDVLQRDANLSDEEIERLKH